MNRSLIAVAVVVLLSACGGNWKIIKQGPADQFAGKSAFVISPADYAQVRIDNKSEQEWLAGSKDPASVQQRWGDVKKGIDEEILKSLTAKAAGITFTAEGQGLTIKPAVMAINPGCPTGYCHSQLSMTFQILGADGAVLDEIQIVRSHGGSVFEATDERRLRHDANEIGRDLAKYVTQRVGK